MNKTDMLKEFNKLKELLSKVCGCSVTTRIKQVKQPRGGYLNPRTMEVTVLGEGMDALVPGETTNPGLVGLAVDYLTRFALGASTEDAFYISMLGATVIKEEEKAKKLMAGVKGLDNDSIINAIKLCGFDVCYRVGRNAYKPVDEIIPDLASVENIRTMVYRALLFFDSYGSKVLDGFTFEGGYTNVVSAGDGDFTTEDTLWDFKVTKCRIKKEHTLQLLMYWRMGLHSIHPEFKNIKYLGIFNPRQNTVLRIAVADIPEEIIKIVDVEIIGYKE